MKHAAHICVIGVLIIVAMPAWGGRPSQTARVSDILPSDGYVYTAWGAEDGLPSADTWSIMQDRTGYIWIGTGFGVARFDGVTFTTFSNKNTSAFHGQQVMAIHEDARGRIWVGVLSGGLAIYENGQFTIPRFAEQFAYRSVDGIFADSAGHTYLCTTLGAYRVEGDSVVPISGLPETPRTGFTTPDGTVYFTGLSLVRMNGPGKKATVLVDGTGEGHSISDVLYEPDGRVFVVRQGEIRRYQRRADGTLDLAAAITSPGALKIKRDGTRGYFVGTIGYGVVYFDGTTFSHPQGLGVRRGAGRQTHSLMVSREGGLWATTSGGVYRFSRTFFTILGPEAGFLYDYSWLVRLQRNGTLWMGVGPEGTYRYDGTTARLFTSKDGMPDDHISDLFEASDGTMWFGGTNGRIASYKDGRFRAYPAVNGETTGRVQSISEDHVHQIWVGTRKGLYRLKDGRLEPLRLADGSTVPPARHVTHLPDGTIWCIASANVARIRDGAIRIFSGTPDRGFYGTTAMLVDTGRVWFGSYGGGLYLISADSVIDVNRVCPGVGPRVIAIHEDTDGYLWINAERELQRVRKRDILAAIALPSATVPLDVFDHGDGLRDIEFNMASEHSAQQLPDGRLLYASTGGIVAVTPRAASRPTTPPPVTIERIVADDVTYYPSDQVVLPPGTRRIHIEFTALRFRSPGRLQFRYRLSGVDRDWVYTQGPSHGATYTRTGPGDIVFQVAASMNGGEWNSTPTIVRMSVTPFVYERPWVQALGLLLLVAAILGAWRWRTRRVIAHNRRLEAEVQRRVEAEARIRSSLEEKTVMLKEIHHRVKNNMQIISSLFSLQLGNSRDPLVLDMLKESQTRIRSMALVHEALYRSNNLAAIDFRDYVQGLAAQIAQAHQRRNVTLRFLGESVTLSLDQAIPAGLLMNEALSNAYKHAFPRDEQGLITVSSHSDHGTAIELSVSDDGPGLPDGFDPATVTSLGFHLMSALTEQLGGTLTISGKPGTTVKVTFPIG